MKAQVMEMFEQGYEVVVGNVWGESAVESVEEIEDAFQEAEEDDYVELFVEIDEEARRVELFLSCDE